MQEKYRSVNELISQNYKAKEFFMTLPEDVQGKIVQRTQSITSYEVLRDYGEALLRGDE